MATTGCDLYRSVMDRKFKNIRLGVYPGNGVLDPRWEEGSYWSKKQGREIPIRADVVVVEGKDGPEVEPGGGTSLHDVPGWFPNHDFWIPEGTVHSGELVIKKDDRLKTSPSNAKLQGHHYQIECLTQMTVATMKGYLDNMARSAVARQCELVMAK